jgi:hypothetical protein
LFKIESTNPSDNAELSFLCDDVDIASRLCVDLFQDGYKIRRITLPDGALIENDGIETVIKAGLADEARTRVSASESG